MARRLRALRRLRTGPRLRPRALARLARAPAGRALARDPVRVRVRLRVRARAARPRLPRGDARRRPGGDPAGTPRRGSAPAARKVRRYPGLKEEYYLAGFEPDPAVLDALGLDPDRVLVVVRTPPDVSLYHRHGNPLFADVLRRLGADPEVQAVVLPRTAEQRADDRARSRSPSLVRPRARRRRTEPRRARRSRGLGGRDDEPGGCRARRSRLTRRLRVALGAVDEMLVHGGRLGVLTSAA